MSDNTLNLITMTMQIVNTLDQTSFKQILTAFGTNDEMDATIDSLLSSIKQHQNYIVQKGGEDGDEIVPYQQDQIALPGREKPQSKTVLNVILMILGLVLSLLFVSFGVGAIGSAIQGGVDEFATGLQDIASRMPVSPLSEAIIEGDKNVFSKIVEQLTEKTYDTPAILSDETTSLLPAPTDAIQPSDVLQSSISNIKDFRIPDMTTTERLGLLLGHIPTGYLSDVSDELTGVITRDVTPVVTRMILSASEAAASRAWNQGTSGNLFVRGIDSVTSFLGLGGSLPDSKMVTKALDTFQSRMQLSLTEITTLLRETTTDMTDNIIANVYGYSALAATSFGIAVLNASSLALRMASNQAQRNTILRNTSILMDKLTTPTLYAYMYASEGVYRGIGYILDLVRQSGPAPPGSVAGIGQYGGKKRKRTRKNKSSHKKRSKQTKNNKKRRSRSILKRPNNKKQGSKTKRTKTRRCVRFNLRKKHTRRN